MPVRLTMMDGVDEVLFTVSVAVFAPADVGVKVTLMVVVAPWFRVMALLNEVLN